ncbi:hypothetical protein [Pseudoalteromonas piscicida]|uniref:Uncharacterized protein n=1 Tax=Pseudoalteromonas piscicida TaxID=43662 RepID=A0A2A5JRM0_PSEO7|nr:hypothetical protein [Pseudoalteromonas piscicida]PCK32040.1 hypothetical protein CEX98_09455 [Pseudoalteromonas piscicida]
MTMNFRIHSASLTMAPAKPAATQVKAASEAIISRRGEAQQPSDKSNAIAAYTGDIPNSSPYNALLNPEGFDFDNMSLNEFYDVVDAIRTLEFDIERASGNTGSLRDTFWHDVMSVKGSLEGVNYEKQGIKPDEKINISQFYGQSVDEARNMEEENYRSFHGVLGYAQEQQETVALITSESFLKEYQEKAVAFLKAQETQLIDTQA